MPPRAGIGAQLGVAPEVTYGTYVAPTRFVPFDSEGLELDQKYAEHQSLRAGRLARSGDLVRKTTRQAAGPINRPVLTKGEGIWLNQGHGNTVTPAQVAATIAYTQSHEFGETDPFGKSLSIQVGRPDVNGTVRPYTALGSKVLGYTWSCERDGDLMLETAIDAQDLVTSEALATATYTAGAETFGFDQCAIQFDDVVYTDCVQSFTIALPIPSRDDRFCIGGGALKKQPIQNGLLVPTITLEMEFESNTQYDAFLADTRRKLEIIFTGEEIVTGQDYSYGHTFMETVTKAAGPKVEGEDVIMQTVQFEAVDDGTNPVMVIDVKSTDTAL